MLVLPNHFIKSEKTSTRSRELEGPVAKTKLKSPKKKAAGSNKITSKTISHEKLASTVKIYKTLISNHVANFNSSDTFSKNIKAAKKISKLAETEHNVILIKSKLKNGISLDKSQKTLESKRIKKSVSNASKIKKRYTQSDVFNLNPNVHTKGKPKKIVITTSVSKGSKSQSSQIATIKNINKIKRVITKPTKRVQVGKNSIEKIIQNSARSEGKLKRQSSTEKLHLKPISELNEKSKQKHLQKDVPIQTVAIPIELKGPQIVIKEKVQQKSRENSVKPKLKTSDDNSQIFKIRPKNKHSFSFRKKIVDSNTLAKLPMHRKINSLELMNRVYPRVEVNTTNASNGNSRSSSNSGMKCNTMPRKLHSDNMNQVRLKSKTLFDFKKPNSAPESRKHSNKLQKLSSSVPSHKTSSANSLNIYKLPLVSSPKWQIQRISDTAKAPESDLVVLRAIADASKMKHKTFTCCGGYRTIKNALEARGWIERINIYQSGYDDLTRQLYKLPISDLILGIHDKNTGVVHRRVILSKLLGSHQVDFYWDYSHDVYHGNPDSVKLTIINSIQRGVFSYATKRGLCESSKDAYWYHKPGKFHLRHPRSYSLISDKKPDDFIRDFKITACISLLKWIADMPKTKSSKLTSEQGKISIQHFQFAMKECMKFMQKLKHVDIDKTIPEASEKEWTNFLESYSEAVHRGNHFKTNIYETETTLVHKSNTLLAKLRKCWPFCNMDGSMNIWILKPSSGSRGIGIHICRTLSYVLKILNENKNNKYVIQKYIERPLLIFNTKFDIRQWFLISSTCPLTIWIYKDCYLRFSSQTYNLRKLHESIHLTNNSVQSRYHSTVNRDPSIPDYNMWDLSTFKQHLVTIGYAGVFEKIIYPGMKECIAAAILMNQDHLNRRKNSFQLHGADFMLTEDFQPWLIEINARPALYSSTPITASMCPKVLTDTIRVIIDLKDDRNAPTGLFELLYKQEVEKLPNTIFDRNMFIIQGHAIKKDYFQTPEQAIAEGNLCNSKKSSEIMDITNNKNFILQVGREMRTTLEQLLSLINNEKNRRKLLKKQLGDPNSLKRKELKELYKKGDLEALVDGNVQMHSSMELSNVLYNTLSNNVLNTISNDAKQLHGMISKELSITSTASAHSINTNTVQKQDNVAPLPADESSLTSHEINKYCSDAERVKECVKEVAVMKPSGGLFNNFLGMISSLSFN